MKIPAMLKHPLTRTLLFVLAGLLVVIDRAAWASVSQWHNDQAISIWLGYTRGLLDLPVGLVSTDRVPNPNGMFIVAYFLSRLPNLWFISTFLGCVQAALIICICRSLFPYTSRLFFVASVPLLVSVILRPSSVEFWNQYFMTFINLFFLLWSLSYWSKPGLWKIPLLIALVCWAPALYLAGIINSLAMMLIGAGLVLYRPPAGWKTNSWGPLAASLAVIAVSARITWWPYFHSVSLAQLLSLNSYGHPNGLQMLRAAAISILGFPVYGPVQWAIVTFLNNSNELLSGPAILFNRMTILTGVAQGALALIAVLFGLRANWSRRTPLASLYSNSNKAVLRIVGLSAAFIVASYTLSPILAGPAWAQGQRTDQLIQFLPLFMFVSFLSPFIFRLPAPLNKFITWLSYSLVIIYAIVNIAAGVFIVKSHLDYRGDVLLVSDMDVPLVQKMQAVDFIAADWKSISNKNVIPVDYRLVGRIWGWIPEFGQQMQEWYPAPMTLGRSFDYDLLRRYGLWNSQEGIQFRSFGTGRYLVTYAFEPAPELPGISLRHYVFGRLRVSIVQ